MSLKNKILLGGILSVIALFLFIVIANWRVTSNAKHKIYTSTTNIPFNKTGLLLGTSKLLSNGHVNLYYTYRIQAAVKLFRAKKIQFFIVSGDNSRKEYDEPTTMKEDLIKAGIPAKKIYLDYAGFRTLDSVVRCKEIFGQNKITVISQQFHNERAIYIAASKGIQAIGFNAQDVSARYGWKIQLREKLARTKMVLDLIFGVQPKFLGEKIEIK